MSKRKSIIEVKELFRKSNIEPLFEEYNNYMEKLLYRCSCGELAKTSMIVINNGFNKFGDSFKLHCPKCKNKILSDRKNSNQINKVKKLFERSNSEFIEYFSGNRNGMRPTVKFKCGGCGEIVIQIFRIRKDCKNNSDFLCEKCIRSIRAKERIIEFPNTNPDTYNVKKYTYREIKDIFLKYGVIPLFKKYEDKFENLEFICKCGKKWHTNFYNIQYNNIEPKCDVCTKRVRYESGLKNVKYLVHKFGKNHPNWNPLLTDEDRESAKYGRGNKFKIWSNFLLKFYDYTCQISNKRGNKLAVHHLNAWAGYKDQRYAIFNGVVLSREMHEKFHKKFGIRGNTTIEDFRIFYEEETGETLKTSKNIYSEIIFSEEESRNLLKKKKEYAEKGINYIPIFQHEIILKSKIISSILRAKIGILEEKIYARNLEVSRIEDSSWKNFIEENHRQKVINSEIALGLYKNKNELVSIMVFGKPRFGSYDYELLRFVSKLNCIVVGGASKLFKYFIKNYKFNSVISYADLRFSDLDFQKTVYPKLGFKHSHISKSNYWYTKDGINIYSRVKFQRHRLDKIFNKEFDKSLSERDIMLSEGYQRLYDCGNHVFIYKK